SRGGTPRTSVPQEILHRRHHPDFLDLRAALVAVVDGDHALVGAADAAQARAGVLGELRGRFARIGGGLCDEGGLDAVELGVVELGLAALGDHHSAPDQFTAAAQRRERLGYVGGAQAHGVAVAVALGRAVVAVGPGPAVLQPRRRDHDLVLLEA